MLLGDVSLEKRPVPEFHALFLLLDDNMSDNLHLSSHMFAKQEEPVC